MGEKPQQDRAEQQWRLVVFAHPRCPCLRETLGEVEALLASHPTLAVEAWIVVPPDAPKDWARAENWKRISRIPRASLAVDDGTAARRYGAETSGYVVLIDPVGRWWFRGGLTASRGHAGYGEARKAIEDLLRDESRGGVESPVEMPVFGCPLFTPET